MANEREKAAAEGIENAWIWWLGQHPITVPEMIDGAISKTFRDWLNENKAEVLEAIARKEV